MVATDKKLQVKFIILTIFFISSLACCADNVTNAKASAVPQCNGKYFKLLSHTTINTLMLANAKLRHQYL